MRVKDNNGNFTTTAKIAGVGIVAVGAIVAYKCFSKDEEESDSEDVLDDLVKDVDVTATTITTAQAQDIANRLYNAMKGYGTSESEIESLLIDSKLTSNDLKMVVSAFGTKKYGTFGAPAFEWLGGTYLDLRGWLKKECSTSLYTKLAIKFDQAGFLSGLDLSYNDLVKKENILQHQLNKIPVF